MASTKPLTEKLRLESGQRALVLNAPNGYTDRLQPLPAGLWLETAPGEGAYDFVHLFVQNQSELAEYGPVALDVLEEDALLWISYPKKSSGVESDLSRDEGWALLENAGYRPVAQAAVDDVWSAMRFRAEEFVGTS